MKIVLFGYGKMGKLIEEMALKRGHTIHLIVNQENAAHISTSELQGADIAIDFSTPQSALSHINLCMEADLPLVTGTTGWYEQLENVKSACQARNKSLLYGSNFSVGVNIVFHMNKQLAKIMAQYQEYDVLIEEIHHTQKLDSPSGTAISLAKGVLEFAPEKDAWINYIAGNEPDQIPKKNELLIESHRIEDVPGTHTLIYSSEIDQIELKHIAHNRNGFALGAVLGAEWLQGKKGFYEVSEMFAF